MNRLREILALLFPMRTHLEGEIEYLKAQLAQERRRNDELRQALVELKQPKVIVREPIKEIPSKPIGWESFRRANKESDITEPKEELNGTTGE